MPTPTWPPLSVTALPAPSTKSLSDAYPLQNPVRPIDPVTQVPENAQATVGSQRTETLRDRINKLIELVNELEDFFVPLDGSGNMDGALDMGGHQIKNVEDGDLVSKATVDDVLLSISTATSSINSGIYVASSGGLLTGPLDMGNDPDAVPVITTENGTSITLSTGYRILNIANPSAAPEDSGWAVSAAFVDSAVTSINTGHVLLSGQFAMAGALLMTHRRIFVAFGLGTQDGESVVVNDGIASVTFTLKNTPVADNDVGIGSDPIATTAAQDTAANFAAAVVNAGIAATATVLGPEVQLDFARYYLDSVPGVTAPTPGTTITISTAKPAHRITNVALPTPGSSDAANTAYLVAKQGNIVQTATIELIDPAANGGRGVVDGVAFTLTVGAVSKTFEFATNGIVTNSGAIPITKYGPTASATLDAIATAVKNSDAAFVPALKITKPTSTSLQFLTSGKPPQDLINIVTVSSTPAPFGPTTFCSVIIKSSPNDIVNNVDALAIRDSAGHQPYIFEWDKNGLLSHPTGPGSGNILVNISGMTNDQIANKLAEVVNATSLANSTFFNVIAVASGSAVLIYAGTKQQIGTQKQDSTKKTDFVAKVGGSTVAKNYKSVHTITKFGMVDLGSSAKYLAVSKTYTDPPAPGSGYSLPAGVMVPWGGRETTLAGGGPKGWGICDRRMVNNLTAPGLFNTWIAPYLPPKNGYATPQNPPWYLSSGIYKSNAANGVFPYNDGDGDVQYNPTTGLTTFRLPDLRGRIAIGVSTAPSSVKSRKITFGAGASNGDTVTVYTGTTTDDASATVLLNPSVFTFKTSPSGDYEVQASATASVAAANLAAKIAATASKWGLPFTTFVSGTVVWVTFAQLVGDDPGSGGAGVVASNVSHVVTAEAGASAATYNKVWKDATQYNAEQSTVGATYIPYFAKTGGTVKHLLAVAELPAHQHAYADQYTDPAGAGTVITGVNWDKTSIGVTLTTAYTTTTTVMPDGSTISPQGISHDNLQPGMCLAWIIKL